MYDRSRLADEWKVGANVEPIDEAQQCGCRFCRRRLALQPCEAFLFRGVRTTEEDVTEQARAESPMGADRHHDRVRDPGRRQRIAMGVRAVQHQALNALPERRGKSDGGAGPGGDIGWTAPDAEQFRFHIEQTRHIAAHLCGRGLYQEMLVWETAEQTMSGEAELEFARIWRPIPKVVFSRTLDSVAGNARLATGDIAAEVAVDGANSVGSQHFRTDERVRQRRLACPGRADQHDRAVQHRGQDVERIAGRRADRKHRAAWRDRLHRRHRVRDMLRRIGFREDDDRLRAAFPGECEHPLDAAEVDVAVERGHDADGIDVRGKRLRLGAAGNRRPHDRGSSWDEVDDRSVGDRHPVTGAQVEPAGTHAQQVAGCNGVADGAVDAGDAGRGGVVCEALANGFGPAVLDELVCRFAAGG